MELKSLKKKFKDKKYAAGCSRDVISQGAEPNESGQLVGGKQNLFHLMLRFYLNPKPPAVAGVSVEKRLPILKLLILFRRIEHSG